MTTIRPFALFAISCLELHTHVAILTRRWAAHKFLRCSQTCKYAQGQICLLSLLSLRDLTFCVTRTTNTLTVLSKAMR